MGDMTWEQCVREVTLAADPERVAEVGDGWRGLAGSLNSLRDALIGLPVYGPYAPGTERPHNGGLATMLADWRGSGGDAYREHLKDLGKEIEELANHATNVTGALTRIESDIRMAVASIPVPLMDDFGWNEWSLPNGTELDPAGDGSDADRFLDLLRKDYASDPSSYNDGAFREKADDLEATMKMDGKANDQERGGFWDTDSHLNNWYRDNTASANTGASPLPTAVQAERPRLVVPPPDGSQIDPGIHRDQPKVPTFGGGGGPGGVGSGFSAGGSSGLSGSGYHVPSVGGFTPPAGGSPQAGGSHTSPSAGSGYPTYPSSDHGTGLAGAGPVGAGYGGQGGLGGGAALGGGIGSGSPGMGSSGGFGAGGGAAGAAPVGAIPGMVGGGYGKIPPMTSAASALRNAVGAGPRGAGGIGMMGSTGMVGGGMTGGRGAGGHGEGASGHSSWLTEDDDPWGADNSAAPGILR